MFDLSKRLKPKSESKFTFTLRGGFYALTIILGLQVALIELDAGRADNYFKFGLILAAVFLVELYTGWVYSANTQGKQIINHRDSAKRLEEAIHHFLIPIGLYVSALGYLFFNRQPEPRAIFMLLLFLALWLLFVNIRAYYEKKETLLDATNYIYDAAKIILLFAAADVFFNALTSPDQALILVFCTSLLSLGLLILGSIRYRKFELKVGLLLIGLSIIMGALLIVLIGVISPNSLQFATFSSVIFYLISAFTHHITHRTLSKELLLEYSLVVAIVFLLLEGMA